MVSNNLRGRVTDKASRLLNKIADELLNSNPNAIFRNGDSIMAFADYEIVRESADEYSIYRNDYIRNRTKYETKYKLIYPIQEVQEEC